MTRSVIGKRGRMWYCLRKEVDQLFTFLGYRGVDNSVAFVVGISFLLEDRGKSMHIALKTEACPVSKLAEAQGPLPSQGLLH